MQQQRFSQQAAVKDTIQLHSPFPLLAFERFGKMKTMLRYRRMLGASLAKAA
jgi:hypothetical protein